jgi:hypothetical protein
MYESECTLLLDSKDLVYLPDSSELDTKDFLQSDKLPGGPSQNSCLISSMLLLNCSLPLTGLNSI